MEIQQLRHFVAAAETTSYAQAAKSCFTSRQNIAHSIKVLENELNIVLFERRGNTMVLTPAGEQATVRAREVIAKVDNLRIMFQDGNFNAVPLTLAISGNIFAGIPSTADDLFADYPGAIRIFELECEECYRYTCMEKADAALVMCLDRDFSHCDSMEIATSIAFALVNKESELASKERIDIEDLGDKELMIMSKPPFQYEPLFDQLDRLGFDHADVDIITSTSSMVHVVRRSPHAVGIVSERFAQQPPEGTIAIPFADPQLHWSFYMLYRKNQYNSPAIEHIAREVQQAFIDDGGCGTVKAFGAKMLNS